MASEEVDGEDAARKGVPGELGLAVDRGRAIGRADDRGTLGKSEYEAGRTDGDVGLPPTNDDSTRTRLLAVGWPGATLLMDDPIVVTLFSDWSALPKSMDRNPERTSTTFRSSSSAQAEPSSGRRPRAIWRG